MLRILSGFFLAAFLLLFCACTPKDNSPATSATSAANTTLSQQTSIATKTTIQLVTAAKEATTSVSTSSVVETASNQTTTAVSTTVAKTMLSSKPSTSVEIVRYFNSAANMVKIKKPGYQSSSKAQTQEKNITLSTNVPLHSFISKFIASKINSTKATVEIVNKGASHKNFPVKGQNWASKLEPSALKSASLVDKGAYYEIVLKFKEEKHSALPDKSEAAAHGKAFSLLLDKDFRSAFGGFDIKLPGIKVRADNQKFAPDYHDCYIKCKVEKSSGKMINATYFLNTFSDVDTLVKANNKEYLIGIHMEYAVTEEYQFN